MVGLVVTQFSEVNPTQATKFLLGMNAFFRSFKTCSDEGGQCTSPGDCCTGTCNDGGICTDNGEDPHARTVEIREVKSTVTLNF